MRPGLLTLPGSFGMAGFKLGRMGTNEWTGKLKFCMHPRGSFTNYVASRGGIRQMPTLLYNSYSVKVATKGGRGQNFLKNGYIICEQN